MKDLLVIVKLVLTERKDIVYSVLLGFVAGLAAIGLVSSSGYLISKAALTPPLYALSIMIALLKGFSIVRAVARYGERYFSHRATFNILSHLRVNFYEKLEPLAPNIFQKYRSGDLLARIVGDVESLQNFFLRVFYPPIVLLLVFFATVMFTMFYSISIALLLLLGLVLTGVVLPTFFAFMQKRQQHLVREERARLSTEATELLHGYRDLKLYQKLEQKQDELTLSSDAYIKGQRNEGKAAVFNQSLHSMTALLISWTVLALGAYLIVIGEIDGVFLAMLVMISLTSFENATPMAIVPIHFEDSRRASKRLFSVVKKEMSSQKTVSTKKKLQQIEAPSIELHNVSFTFTGEERKTITDVSFTLPKGSKTAIVGPSGSGKSTVMQLILNIQAADRGDIFYNQTNTNELDQESIWDIAKVVLQDNHFFYGTIKDNLSLASEEATDTQMSDALTIVDLSHFSLSDQVFEKGENLSGGEKQRLALARAILKEGHLWVLDEPTSSVDALTERKIFDYLAHKTKNDTVILISHKLQGLEKMDQIIVMENGSMIESGSYDELMKRQGYFYEMKQLEKELFMA
ncbi:thiol reductant ABC exporter subunit CydC [Bacillus sp. FJAT-45037]|uniref:thiol reductant ABC exporter subunit CydC n=1 Tax=Bacillus sp. FJAT-45037 TaxID=2011007 RepID=UPI000C241CB1|nr:thiol reductant ABC exporter subunit CydC [Bacillus sp. FJAT-45037]